MFKMLGILQDEVKPLFHSMKLRKQKKGESDSSEREIMINQKTLKEKRVPLTDSSQANQG